MLWISVDPQNMGEYLSYFVDDTMIHLGYEYYFQLRGYDAWAEYIMNLIRFREITSAFYPESGTSFCREKCYWLRYFICMFNDKPKGIFVIGDHGDFDEGVTATRIRYCPVQMYNKDKLQKYRVDF